MDCSASRSRSRILRREVVGLDWAPVLRVALENAAQRPGGRPLHDAAGERLRRRLRRAVRHAILLTNFLHHFDPATCIGLLEKVRAALKPGGCAATLEFVPNDDRVSPPMPAAFALTMLTSTVAGDAYTFRELADMHRQRRLQRGIFPPCADEPAHESCWPAPELLAVKSPGVQPGDFALAGRRWLNWNGLLPTTSMSSPAAGAVKTPSSTSVDRHKFLAAANVDHADEAIGAEVVVLGEHLVHLGVRHGQQSSRR